MNEDIYCEIFEWPDRFLVEASEPDREWEKLFRIADPDPLAPYLVDLSECDEGFCGCRYFFVNILPHDGDIDYPEKTCKHIKAVTRYLKKLQGPPKKMQATIQFK